MLYWNPVLILNHLDFWAGHHPDQFFFLTVTGLVSIRYT